MERQVGDLPYAGRSETCPTPRLRGDLEVGDAEDGALGLVGEALDFPAVREDNLLDDGQAQASALLLGCEVRLEDFIAAFGGDARAVVADLEDGFGGPGFRRRH